VAGDTHRLTKRHAEVVAAERDGLAVQLVGVASVELEVLSGNLDVGARLGERLAGVEGLDVGQLVGTLTDQARELEKESSAPAGREAGPRGLGPAGCVDGALDVSDRRRGDLGEDLAGGGVAVDDQTAARRAEGGLTVDDETGIPVHAGRKGQRHARHSNRTLAGRARPMGANSSPLLALGDHGQAPRDPQDYPSVDRTSPPPSNGGAGGQPPVGDTTHGDHPVPADRIVRRQRPR
jgi:hypothetical protein